MKYIYIDKETKQVKMESTERMDLPQFDIQEIDEKEDLSGHVSYFKDNKIEKIPILQDKQHDITSRPNKEDLLLQIDNAKNIEELKNIIKQLL
jgi:hypothetical protein